MSDTKLCLPVFTAVKKSHEEPRWLSPLALRCRWGAGAAESGWVCTQTTAPMTRGAGGVAPPLRGRQLRPERRERSAASSSLRRALPPPHRDRLLSWTQKFAPTERPEQRAWAPPHAQSSAPCPARCCREGGGAGRGGAERGRLTFSRLLRSSRRCSNSSKEIFPSRYSISSGLKPDMAPARRGAACSGGTLWGRHCVRPALAPAAARARPRQFRAAAAARRGRALRAGRERRAAPS